LSGFKTPPADPEAVQALVDHVFHVADWAEESFRYWHAADRRFAPCLLEKLRVRQPRV
jgi:hypothetical protein